MTPGAGLRARWLLGLLLGVFPAAVVVPQADSARSPGALSPRTPLDSAKALDSEGLSLFRQGGAERLAQAMALFLRASTLYARGGDRSNAALMVSNVAFVQNALGRSDSAIVYFGRAIEMARAASDTALLASTITLLGQAHHNRGRLDSALAHYRTALSTARRIHDERTEATNLSNIGIAFNALGQVDSAQHYLGEALVMRRRLRDSLGLAVTLNNLASTEQTLGRPDSAITYLRESLAIRRALGDRAAEGLGLNQLAFAYETLERYDSALVYYRGALAALQQTGRRSIAAISLVNMGRVFLALGRTDSSLVYLRQGLAVKREVKEESGESWALHDLGRVYQRLEQPDSALFYYHAALALLRRMGDRPREGTTLGHIGSVHHERRVHRDLRAATAYYDSAAAVRVAVGTSSGNDANRLSFAEQDAELFERWTLALLARRQEVGRDSAALTSLAAAERGRAQALLDLIRARRGAPARARTATDSADRVASFGGLAGEGRRLVRSIAGSNVAALTYLVTSDTLVVWLITPNGEIRYATQRIPRDSLARLVARVRGGLGVDDAATGAQVAARGSPPMEAEARAIVSLQGITTGLSTDARRLEDAETAAGQLATLLFPRELRAGLAAARELILMPSGPLNLLPFAVLPFVGARAPGAFALRYAPSLAALHEAERRPAPARVGDLSQRWSGSLIVGNPTMPRATNLRGEAVALTSLADAEQEAKSIAAMLRVQPLIGAAASEDTVRRLLAGAPLIHLATHGYAFASEAGARSSFVALAPGAASDGVLTVGELLDDATLSSSAELVVLSACQTGLGNVSRAEGTVGLQRAFLGKGARSVLVSLWNVGDQATRLLMERFYSHWLRDADAPSKANALRRAQNDVRRTPGLAHPRFWAAFQVVGAR